MNSYSYYKGRFGLFSYQGCLASGEDTYSKPTPFRKSQDGRVPTGPKNFYAGRPKTNAASCFSSPLFNAIGDTYADPERPQKSYKEKADKVKTMHQRAWKGGGTSRSQSLYKHIPEGPPEPKSTRNFDGSVITGPKGFFTKPAKKGSNSTNGISFGEYAHIEDPYERKSEFLREQAKKQREKIIGNSFRTMSHGNSNFVRDKKLFSTEGISAAKNKFIEFQGIEHQRPFISNCFPKSRGSFSNYPHVADPGKERPKTSAKQTLPWKATSNSYSLPQRSVYKPQQFSGDRFF